MPDHSTTTTDTTTITWGTTTAGTTARYVTLNGVPVGELVYGEGDLVRRAAYARDWNTGDIFIPYVSDIRPITDIPDTDSPVIHVGPWGIRIGQPSDPDEIPDDVESGEIDAFLSSFRIVEDEK